MVALPSELASTLESIDDAILANHQGRRQNRLSGGKIGKPCDRAIFYDFRWVTDPETFTARTLRIFESGHIAETRVIKWLRDAGLNVEDRDPETGGEFEYTSCDGHFVGKFDGIVTGLKEAPKTPHLLEIKSMNDKNFGQLVKHGLAVAKPEYLAQIQSYLHISGFTRALFIALNKNDDQLYAERIHYDAAHAAALMAKAERIKAANEPPARIADDPASFACKFCSSKPVCHLQGGTILRNCRTCLHSEPFREGPMWFCHRHETILQISDQEAGCPHHLYLPGLIAGEQVDADPEKETVTYLLADGSTWIDGEGRKA
jgi:hypothetical protein